VDLPRRYLVEYDRDALVVDARGSAGGEPAMLLLEKLCRRRVTSGLSRWGPPRPWPPHSPAGPVVCLTSELTRSGGELFSRTFQALGVGPLVGTRTMSGAAAISDVGEHRLADGTITTYPEVSYLFDGVGPDVEVENAPQDHARGADVVLERAIQVVMELLSSGLVK
jgi:tricorn protease